MVGKLGNIRGENLKPILALVVTKSILTPILTHILVDQMSVMFTGTTDPALSNFGFLYGTFPTALGVDSYASQYNVNPDLVSAAIVICTAFSAPLMYVSANILTVLDMDRAEYLAQLRQFQWDISCFSVIGVLLIAMIFIVSRRFLRMPHSLSFALLAASLQTAVGGFIWATGVQAGSWKRYLEVVLHLHGIYTCRIMTAILALVLLQVSRGQTGWLEDKKPWLLLAGPVLASLPVLGLAVTCRLDTDLDQDLLLAFGHPQDCVNMVVLSCSFLVTVSCLVLLRREQGRRGSSASLPPRSCPALTLSTGEKCEPGEKEKSGLERACSTAEESPQLFRHSLLLMLLATSSFSGVAITASRLADIWAQDGQFAGVYKVLVFLNTFLAL